jgi:cysteine desulfurase
MNVAIRREAAAVAEPVYLDHNATTPVANAVVAEMVDALERTWANPSSTHGPGQAARRLLADARARVAAFLGCQGAELVFTSGATEANHMAVQGVLAASRPGPRRRLVLSAVEHPGLLALAQRLRAEGTPVDLIPVDAQGRVDLAAAADLVADDVALVSVMGANNETGVLLPVRELAALARDRGALFFTDAVQAVGKIEVDVRTLGADLVSLTGQKFGGPRGTGALWVRSGLRLTPLFGGTQERGRRAGTENLPGIAGLGAAIEAATARREEEQRRIGALRDRLEAGLLAAVPGARVNGAGAPRLPGTLSITLPGADAEALLIALDLEGICASAGSACHSGSTKPSSVLAAIGLSLEEARSTLRLSLGWTSETADVDAALEAVPRLAARVRAEITAA